MCVDEIVYFEIVYTIFVSFDRYIGVSLTWIKSHLCESIGQEIR